MTNALLVSNPQAIQTAVDGFHRDFRTFLEELGLPTDKVLVDTSQRRNVLATLNLALEQLPSAHRAHAFYISKFIAACGAGLFDAALTYLWDEVVVSLRIRVVSFDLSYFFDSAITDVQERPKYVTEEHLRDVDDWALVKGCLRCGILTEVGYKHLDYIRDMRNWASAAHPNQYQLSGLQLTSWMETCIREVLAKPIDGPVLEVRRLLENLRTKTLAAADVPAISRSVAQLPEDLATALLRSCFGLYCDPRQDARVRNNITLVARAIWLRAPESARHEVGLKYAIYSANADIDRKEASKRFLELVDGLTYLPESDRALEVKERVEALVSAHRGLNNFANEIAPARELLARIPMSGDIPAAINAMYVKYVVYCWVGRPQGVSNGAVGYYEKMYSRFGDNQFKEFVQLLTDADFQTRLLHPHLAQRFRGLAVFFTSKTSNAPITVALKAISQSTDAQLPNLGKDARYIAILARL